MAAAAAIGGGVLSGIGTIKSGQAQQVASQYNADTDNQNAATIEQQGALAVQKQQRSAAQTIGSARAQYAASGIDSGAGSALDVIQNSAQQASLDSMLIKYNTDAKAYSLRKSADLTLFEGDTALTSSYLSAAGGLLGGGGKAAGAM